MKELYEIIHIIIHIHHMKELYEIIHIITHIHHMKEFVWMKKKEEFWMETC